MQSVKRVALRGLRKLVNDVPGVKEAARNALTSLKLDAVSDADAFIEQDYRRWYGDAAVDNWRFYNVGSYKFRRPFWTNIDYPSEHYSKEQGGERFVPHDLESDDPFGIDGSSAAIVYTSHTIEHITDKAAAKLFREAFRTLRPGGVFRVTAPNWRLDYEAWRRGDIDHFYWAIERSSAGVPGSRRKGVSLTQMFLAHFATQLCVHAQHGGTGPVPDEEFAELFGRLPPEEAADALTRRCRLDYHHSHQHISGHINWWTPDKVERRMREAGFSTVIRSAYGQSISPALRDTRHFDSTHPKLSLYVEAVR